MPKSLKWLCIYSVAQLGKPYILGSYGKKAVSERAKMCQKGYIATKESEQYPNPYQNQSVKIHDCSGLVLAAMYCNSVDESTPGYDGNFHHATTQYFTYSSENNSPTMSNFPYIPGTLVFKTKNSKTKQHVGVYVGHIIDPDGVPHDDAVVEAMGQKWGVVISKVTASKWDCWGILNGWERDTNPDMVFDARINDVVGGTDAEHYTEAQPITINAQAMNPFVATIPAGYNPTLDYDKIKEARISAMMFYGGELFDASHTKQTYLNPHLENQVIQCANAGLPYSLYVNVRARSLIEADEECRALYYVLAKFPPKLGIWLSLQTGITVKSKNDDILNLYYRYIEKWGLKARCGLYLTPRQLDNITWTSMQDKFYLWMIDPMDVSNIDDELLQPEIFEVAD